ncbi:hypothetical protein MJO28_005972 [Puccinia striiformis f. sp. tritici]|uniref:Uncharacterized protein n=1 Tax=Puccinia striiformis f. sp. tritici TaxID=168172 RepID=A0ACC0EG40_9BASI|nr:hypothetical protein MJO28_005972 [Puccinia striiformis f. sp. tritici]
MAAIVQRLEAAATAPPPPPPPAPPPPPPTPLDARAEWRICKFGKDARKIHDRRNPDCAVLVTNGSNFQIWEEEINGTLDYVFEPAAPFLSIEANFKERSCDEQSSIMALFWATVNKDLQTIVGGSTVKSPLAMYESIKSNCKHSNRQHKLRIVEKLINLQLKVLVGELYGLLLQSGFVAPSGVDKKTFEFMVDNRLEAKTNPIFSEVSTIIQSACGQHKNKAVETSTSYAPMDLDTIQSFRQQQGKYVHPDQRNCSTQSSQGPAPQGRPQLSLEKAYWELVGTGILAPPPGNSNTTHQPAPNPPPQHNRLRQLDVPEASDGKFLLDSSASTHVSGNLKYFTTRQTLDKPKTIALAVADCTINVSFKGTIKIPTANGTIEVEDVYYCPGVDGVILSVGRLTEHGWRLNFSGDMTLLISPGNVHFSTTFRNHCWYIEMCKEVINKITSIPSFDSFLWHRRLGHVLDDVVQKYLKMHFPETAEKMVWKLFFCEQCAKSRAVNKKSPGSDSMIPRDSPLDLLVTDIAGPFPEDIAGRKYVLTMRDHASTYIWIGIIETRADAPAKILEWIHHLKNTLGWLPKCLRSDNAPEYTGTLRKALNNIGVDFAPLTPYSPEQNGEAERVNRTIGDMARTMLHESKMDTSFWGFAYQVASYIHNRIPNTKVDTAPLKKLYGVDVDPMKLYPFGAKVLALIPKENRSKLDKRSQDGILVGYPQAGGGWLVWIPQDKKIVHSKSVMFYKFVNVPTKKTTQSSEVDVILNQIVLKLGEEETDIISKTERKAIDNLDQRVDQRLPSNIKRALICQEAQEWCDAAEYKVVQFQSLDVWEPVEPFKGAKVLGARWVFVIKPPEEEGGPEIFRARYVAKGFNQQLGKDCNETYAPTASLNILHLLMAMANKYNYATATFDASSAYLYSPIEEDVYVQPPVEIRPEWKGKIMRLKKAMYEQSVYIYRRSGEFVIIWLHVDDGFVVGSSKELLKSLREAMEKEFKIKWSEGCKRLVGINIKKDGTEIQLDQEKLARQIVEDYHRPIVKRRSTLPDEALEISTYNPVGPTEYRSIVGSLMYLAGGTRPDMSSAVNLLARYSNNPSNEHWLALDFLIGYLKRSINTKLIFKGQSNTLDLWSDANWGGKHERSASGYVVKYLGDSIAWGAKQQTIVALSTCASEYIALSDSSQVLAGLSILLDEIQHTVPMNIYCNNQTTILVANDNASKKKMKYLLWALYVINDFVRENKIKIKWTSTIDQQANIFTKKLGPNKIESAIIKLGLRW